MGLREVRIQVVEKGRLVPLTSTPPLDSVCLGRGVILEQHNRDEHAEYARREATTHLLFLSDSKPVRAECKFERKFYDGQVFPGRMWIIPRHQPYSCSFYGAHGGIVLSIGPAELERHVWPLTHGRPLSFHPAFNVEDCQLRYTLLGLQAAALNGSQVDALCVDALIQAVSLRFVTQYGGIVLHRVPLRGGLPLGSLKRVMEYIDVNAEKHLRLATLAQISDMSLYHFAKLFRQSTGLSPYQYVLQRRIERAKCMLREKEVSVLDVSLSVGFEHPNNFARTFRRLTGGTPTQFRRDHRLPPMSANTIQT